MLVATGFVDEKRMAVTGGCYGGYMVVVDRGHTDRFNCIVNHAGVYDTLAQYASDVTQGRHRAFGGEPWDGLEAIDRWNPARFANGFNTPMLVIHGERDYRVPVDQGLECYGVLKAQGRARAARVLPRREPLGAQAAELAALVPRGPRLARALAEARVTVPVGRRRFVFWVGGAGLASLAGGFTALLGLAPGRADAQGKSSPPPPAAAPAMPEKAPEISDEARALHGVLIARYGKDLDAAQSQGLLEAVENGVQSGRALRAKKLMNGQEPQAIFHVQPMPPPGLHDEAAR